MTPTSQISRALLAYINANDENELYNLYQTSTKTQSQVQVPDHNRTEVIKLLWAARSKLETEIQTVENEANDLSGYTSVNPAKLAQKLRNLHNFLGRILGKEESYTSPSGWVLYFTS